MIWWRVHTDSYHLHVATLEIAMETSSGRWLGLKVSIATAITIVCDIVDGKLLFGIHDCNRGSVRRQGGKGVCRSRGGGGGVQHTTTLGRRRGGEAFM